jgi:aspartate racemase
MVAMLTIGMLGGMSWESSAEYYRLVNEFVRDRLGGFHSARCVLVSVDFAEIERLQATGDWDKAAAVLARAAQQIEAGGADLLVLCTNTMHKVAAQVQAAVTIPLLDLPDVTAEAVLAAGLTTVGLLGTAFTMEQAFYRDRLAAHGLTVLVPDRQDRAAVHAIIYDELCQGIVLDSSRDRYREVIASLTAAGAQGVILGCTEIELLVTQADSPVPVFPTTRLHAEAAVERSLAPVVTRHEGYLAGKQTRPEPAAAQTRRRLHTSQREEGAAPSDAAPGGVR